MGALRSMAVAAVAVVVVALLTAATTVAEDEPQLPDIWKVVEDSYDSRVTVNFPSLKEEGTTMLVDELYDIKEEQGAVEAVARGVTTTINYYSKSWQAFVAVGNECSAGSVPEQDRFGLWGWIFDDSESSGGKQNFLYGPSALLRIIKNPEIQANYTGRKEVRGIIADSWIIYYKEHFVSYYFAVDEWVMPYGHKLGGVNLRAPLMVEVQGMQGNPWNQDQAKFNQTVFYEFTEFIPYVKPKKKWRFLVREGLECMNRETLDPQMKTPPDAPSQFQVFLETVVRIHNGHFLDDPIILRSWLYYSNWMQLLRLDVNADQDAGLPVSAYKSIHDYNTGIEYRIDKDSGACVMSPLGANQLGNQVGSSIIGGVIMADPDNLFHLDDSYIFNGYSESRGIKTTRWTSVRKDILNVETGEYFKKVVVDYHFTSESVYLEGEEDGTSLPVRMDVAVYYDNNATSVLHQHTLNLLHMQSSFQEYDFNPFHVGECMDTPPQRTWLKITFIGKWLHGASQAPDAFKKKVMQYVVEGSKSSYVRFPEVQLDHDVSDLVFASLLILDPAPYHLQFNQMDDRKPSEFDTKLKVNVHDVDFCAYSCLAHKMFNCKSFYKCNGDGKTCYLSNYKNSPGNSVGGKPCQHYNKVLDGSSSVQMPNGEIEVWLEAKILEGNFVIEMPYLDHENNPQTGKYHAIAEQVEMNGDDPIFADLINMDFYTSTKKAKLANRLAEVKLYKVDYATCMANCVGHVSFECETFSFCYNDGSCSLSSTVVKAPAEEGQMVHQSDCVIVVRAHTNDYDMTQGLVYLGDPKETHISLSPENCAYLCDNATDFTCRSFDYCLNNLKCNLYDQHTVDEPDTMFNESLSCMHYSRNALFDFTKHPHQVINGKRDRFIKDTTPGRCAHVCEDEPDFGCNGFDFCMDNNDITCFLTAQHYSDSGVDISDSLTCDHYSRDYYEGQDRDTFAHNKNTQYIYGSGDMAGLGCSMLVISIALTFGGVYAYNKHYKR